MATAGTLLPRDSEPLKPPIPSPSLQTAISQLGSLATGKVLWEEATATEGTGPEGLRSMQVWGGHGLRNTLESVS